MKHLIAYDGTYQISEAMQYHLHHGIPLVDNIFRPESTAYYALLEEARILFDRGFFDTLEIDVQLFENTDIGRFEDYQGVRVPLDLPMYTDEYHMVLEAMYLGKEVQLNHPMRSNGVKKYMVYVKDPKTGRVRKIQFGDIKGGLRAKVSDPEARKRFAQRHRCAVKTDKTTAGYWACRINRYGHLWGGKSYPGYW